MVQILTDAVMCKKHPHEVMEAGNANNLFHLTLFLKNNLHRSV